MGCEKRNCDCLLCNTTSFVCFQAAQRQRRRLERACISKGRGIGTESDTLACVMIWTASLIDDESIFVLWPIVMWCTTTIVVDYCS